MSFELVVEMKSGVKNLRQRWQDEINSQRFSVEILPSFDPAGWQGGFLPIKLTAMPDKYLFPVRIAEGGPNLRLRSRFRRRVSAFPNRYGADPGRVDSSMLRGGLLARVLLLGGTGSAGTRSIT